MKIRIVLMGILLMASVAVRANDASGSWKVTISITAPDGTPNAISGMASLKQSGETLTGWVGPSMDDPIPVTGTVKKDQLTLSTHPQPGRSAAFDTCTLTIQGNRMVGSFQQPGSTDKATIEFTRVSSGKKK